MVWRFDRFARSTSSLLDALNQFRERDIHFVSVQENIDTTTSVGKAIFTIISAIAEFERSIINERVKAGIVRAREKDVKFGRPRKGFDFNKGLELKKSGMSFRQIAKELGVSLSTVWRTLK